MDQPQLSQDFIRRARDFCANLSEADDTLARELMTRISEKWSLWALDVLAGAARPLRFTRLMEEIDGVSQKSLTKTLRQLERDGLITRKMFMEVPPRVEYAITQLGLDLLARVMPLWLWVAESLPGFRLARAVFEVRNNPKPSLEEDPIAPEPNPPPSPPQKPLSRWSPRKWIA
jgi:DNA-binding HxlR family transcriptional regulator